MHSYPARDENPPHNNEISRPFRVLLKRYNEVDTRTNDFLDVHLNYSLVVPCASCHNVFHTCSWPDF